MSQLIIEKSAVLSSKIIVKQGSLNAKICIQEKAIAVEFDSSNSLLEYTITAGADQAGNYINQVHTNVATVVYNLNGADVALPFTIAETDLLKITITRTTANQDSNVKITNV